MQTIEIAGTQVNVGDEVSFASQKLDWQKGIIIELSEDFLGIWARIETLPCVTCSKLIKPWPYTPHGFIKAMKRNMKKERYQLPSVMYRALADHARLALWGQEPYDILFTVNDVLFINGETIA